MCVTPQVFFCKYNDPIYVKMEKLEIMIQLASDKNIDQVLLEFKEYATEVDVDFVRKVCRAPPHTTTQLPVYSLPTACKCSSGADRSERLLVC